MHFRSCRYVHIIPLTVLISSDKISKFAIDTSYIKYSRSMDSVLNKYLQWKEFVFILKMYRS
jgi:hypothetical protein